MASTSPHLGNQTPSSARSSLSIERGPATRRNRSALRDYYKLTLEPPVGTSQTASEASPSEASAATPTRAVEPSTPVEAFDSAGFDAEAYVEDLFASAPLATILKTENALVARIRGLDGEKKALVYDNYSKLIAATETIRRMRGNMDPLTPMTRTLGPAIEEILGQADTIAEGMERKVPRDKIHGQRSIVRRVLDTPRRVQELVSQDKKAEAMNDLIWLKATTREWADVEGLNQITERCEKLLDEDP